MKGNLITEQWGNASDHITISHQDESGMSFQTLLIKGQTILLRSDIRASTTGYSWSLFDE